MYTGENNKIAIETVQSLVNAYNQIEYRGQTTQQINYDKAISITFVNNDQISGSLVIDDKGVFHLNDVSINYQIEPNIDIYQQAIEIYDDIDKRYDK